MDMALLGFERTVNLYLSLGFQLEDLK